MRVGVNVHLLSTVHTGIQHYIRALLPQLVAQASGDEFVLYGEQQYLPLPTGERIRWVKGRSSLRSAVRRVLWEQTILPQLLRRDRIEVFFSPAFVLPLGWHRAGVVTVHDLNFEVSPHTIHPLRRAYLRRFTRWSVRRARKVIVISQAIALDLIRLYRAPAEKLTVIPYGLDEMFNPDYALQMATLAKQTYCLPEHYLLYVGTLEPRKNLPRLLEGYARALSQAELPPLVLVGAGGWQHKRICSMARDLQVDNRVFLAGYIPREHLPGVYASATALLYPSLYEGFGLPPLEAMGCGTPALVSNVSAMPEVVGDAAVLVDPYKAESIAQGILLVCTDDCVRQQSVQKGLERARQYRWDVAARQTLQVIESAAG